MVKYAVYYIVVSKYESEKAWKEDKTCWGQVGVYSALNIKLGEVSTEKDN